MAKPDRDPDQRPWYQRHLNVIAWTVIAPLVIAVGVFGSLGRQNSVASTAFVSGLFLLVAIAGLFRYLKPDTDTPTPGEAFALSEEVQRISAAQQVLNSRLDTMTSPLSDAEKEVFKASIAQEFVKKATIEQLQDTAEHMARERTRSAIVAAADYNTASMLARMHGAIPQSLKRANINLAIGILTTFTGVAVLAYGVLAPGSLDATRTPLEYMQHFVPRLSLAILIEVFAYFFLRLYKSDLDSVRYLQNEMTNVEATRLGLLVSIMTDDREAIGGIANQLARTDRNTATAANNVSPASKKEILMAIELLRAATGLKSSSE